MNVVSQARAIKFCNSLETSYPQPVHTVHLIDRLLWFSCQIPFPQAWPGVHNSLSFTAGNGVMAPPSAPIVCACVQSAKVTAAKAAQHNSCTHLVTLAIVYYSLNSMHKSVIIMLSPSSSFSLSFSPPSFLSPSDTGGVVASSLKWPVADRCFQAPTLKRN